jgi:anti-anti-sigma regulatory factor
VRRVAALPGLGSPTGVGRGMRAAAVRPGDHACAIYRSDEEHWEISADFLAAGLARGERVVCVDDGGTADAVLRRLGEDGLDARRYRARGQLVVDDTRLPTRTGGLSAGQVAAAIEDARDAALRGGFRGFRLAFETGSVLRDTADVEWLLEIDAACAPLWQTAPATGLCQIDARLTDAAQRARIRSRHDREVAAPAMFDDGLLRITGEDGAGRRLAGEIDVGNREALRAELERAVLAGHPALRLAVASLRFADAASVGMLADVAQRLPEGHTIVLERPGALLRKLLEVCGLGRLPGLVVEPDPAQEPA